MSPSNSSYLSNIAIFRFHDYGRKSICFTTSNQKKSASRNLVNKLTLHPGRLTWNLQITHLERNMIFQTSMIMVHVNLAGCIFMFIRTHFLPSSGHWGHTSAMICMICKLYTLIILDPSAPRSFTPRMFEQATLAGSHAGTWKPRNTSHQCPLVLKKISNNSLAFLPSAFCSASQWHNCTRINYLAILFDLFRMIQWPFWRLSDLQLGG